MIALGLGPAFITYLYPFFLSLASVVVVGGLISAVYSVDQVNLIGRQATGAAIYLLSCAVGFWYLLHRPRRPIVVLREKGFTFRKTAFAFDDLRVIYFGRRARGFEAAMRSLNDTIGVFSAKNRAASEAMERTNAASLTVVFRDGDREVLKAVGILCEAGDYQEFLDYLGKYHPRLFEVTLPL